MRKMNKKGEEKEISTITELVLAAIALIVLLYYALTLSGVLSQGGRESDAAIAGIRSFAIELNDIANNGQNHFMKQKVPLTIRTPFFSLIAFPKFSTYEYIKKDNKEYLLLDGYKKGVIYQTIRPATCGEQCICLYEREDIYSLKNDPTEKIIECIAVDADYIVTQTPPTLAKLTKSITGYDSERSYDGEEEKLFEDTLRGWPLLLADSAILEKSVQMGDYSNEDIEEGFRLFTAGTFVQSDGPGLLGFANNVQSISSNYYIEKIVQEGKTFLLILPEKEYELGYKMVEGVNTYGLNLIENKYTKKRATMFKEEYENPTQVLQKYIDEGNATKIITYAEKKIQDSIQNAVTNKNEINIEIIKNFTTVYMNYLLSRPSERIEEQENSQTFIEKASILVAQLLEKFGDQEFVKEETINTYEIAQRPTTPKIKELTKLTLYSLTLKITTSTKSKNYALLKNIVTEKDFWNETITNSGETDIPQRIFTKIKELTNQEETKEKQKAQYLLGLAYKNYDVREENDKKEVVLKRKYDLAIQAFNDAINIDATTNIAQESIKEKNTVCALSDEKIGKEGRNACDA